MKRVLALALVVVLCCAAVRAGDYYSTNYNRGYYDYNRNNNAVVCNTVFASVFQRFAKLKSGSNPDVEFNPTSGAVGFVHQQDSWKAGAALSWEHGKRKVRSSGLDWRGNVESEMPGISLFGAANFQDNWYADASMFFGFRKTRAKNTRVNGAQAGDSKSMRKTVFALSLETGRNFDFGDFIVTPHGGIDYSYTPREPFRFAVRSEPIESANYWEIPLGVTIKKTFVCGDWTVTPKADATIVIGIDSRKPVRNIQPGFSYRTADEWKVAGIGGKGFGARLSAGVEARYGSRTTLGFDYTYEGRSCYNDHRLSAMVGWLF